MGDRHVPTYWKHDPLLVLRNLRDKSEAICYVQEVFDIKSHRIVNYTGSHSNVNARYVTAIGSESIFLESSRPTYRSEVRIDRKSTHAVYEVDTPLNVRLDELSDDHIGIVPSQRAIVLEYASEFYPQARKVMIKYLIMVTNS